jgi:hypothetical protein
MMSAITEEEFLRNALLANIAVGKLETVKFLVEKCGVIIRDKLDIALANAQECGNPDVLAYIQELAGVINNKVENIVKPDIININNKFITNNIRNSMKYMN